MVDALVSVAAENLLKMATDEAMLLIGVHTELEDLSSELRTIQAVLQDAEMKQIKDGAVRIWLQKLKYVAYEIEDMVEAWDQAVRNSSSPFSCMLHPFRHFKFGHKVKTIKEKLAKIASEKDRYHLREIITPVRELEDRQTSSFVEQSSVIGRDRDTEMLRRKLIEEDLACKEGEVPVIAIVGMGGVGKTALAQNVFNSETIKNHFSKCIWVCISNNFIVKDAMLSIVKNGGGKILKENEDQVELIQRKLVELIENKRYLLVVDDVWNEDELKWEPLKKILNRGANGSRIVVTARNNGVARAMRSVHIQDLGLLPNDDCWSIFKKMVFEESNDGLGYKDLEEVGKQIVEKCCGLPLAVKTIASALWMKARGKQPTRGQLENILNSEIWDVSESDVGILPALMLSYIELPSKLKNCFCYCSLFEKDFIFKKDFLSKLWVAQGYIVVNDEQGEVECIAEEYFDELLDRSFFQEPKLDKHGNIKSCKMHDLVHDLAQWLTKTEFSIMKMKEPRNRLMSLGNARHCAILAELRWKKDIALTGVENLRTLICSLEEYGKFTNSMGGVIKHLQSIRVLSLERVRMRKVCGLERLVHLRYLSLYRTQIKVLPKSIGKLKELRYLDLSLTDIKRLPETITSLSHLQTLDLSSCDDLRKLPSGIPRMGSLRHLDVSGCERLKKLPDGIGGLTLLQTLGRFRVALTLGGCSNIGELGGLNRLCQFLSIANLRAVGSEEEARSAKLQDKTSLVDIGLHWGFGESLHSAMDVLESLRPPPQLETLFIDRYPGGAFPCWMGDGSALPLLRNVMLWNCINLTQLPPLGQQPCLEYLSIDGLSGVKEVGEEFLHLGLGDNEEGTSVIAFPQLKFLELRRMDRWVRWAPPLSTSSSSPSSVIQVNKAANANATILPRLRELRLDGCPKLERVPPIFTTALQTLCIEKCPMLRSLQFLPPSIQSLELRGVSTGKLLADCSTGTLPSLQHLEIGYDSELTSDQLTTAHHLFTALQCLKIIGCKNLRTLPEGLTRLTTLESLKIYCCKNLRTLPEGMTRLTNLQKLEIYECSPKLHESCHVGGRLWPMIAHIPRIEINDREVQNLNGH